MSRLVIVLSTNHELQGAEKRAENIDDPLYAVLLEQLIDEEELDFVFEEIAGLGPTTAEKLSQTKLGPNRYLDVDPPRGERENFGIRIDTGEPLWVGNPPNVLGAAHWEFDEVHKRREELWIQRMMELEFTKALMICGLAHGLSFTFRLRSAQFAVKSATYALPVRK